MSELIEWLKEKLAKAQGSVNSRAEMARTMRSGTNKQWAAVGNNQTRRERLSDAERHDKIGVKLQHDVDMFKATLNALGQRDDGP